MPRESSCDPAVDRVEIGRSDDLQAPFPCYATDVMLAAFEPWSMPEVDNLTPFAATSLPSLTRDAEDLLLVVVAGRFELPVPGANVDDPRISGEQRQVPLADVFWSDAAGASLQIEGQSTYVRPGTDIYLEGHAWAPRGRPAHEGHISIRVGPCARDAIVFGDRSWTRGIGAVTPSPPQRFLRLPIRYERCFGGSPGGTSSTLQRAAGRNPVGVGLFASSKHAIGAPLPNFEDPHQLIRSLDDRPAPCGFGPIARAWLPRRQFAGTYDEAWIQTRAPLWPEDLDLRFFCAAAPGLCATPHLRGGEPVRMTGVHPDGEIAFRLPELRLQAKLVAGDRSPRATMILDAILLEPDTGSFTMIWRASLRADLLRCERVVVRQLHPWESGAR